MGKFNNIFKSINYHNCGIISKEKLSDDLNKFSINGKIYDYQTYYWYYYINLNHNDFNNYYCLYGKFMLYSYEITDEMKENFKKIIDLGLSPMIKYSNYTNKKSKTICIYTDNKIENIIKLANFIKLNNMTRKDIPFRANWEQDFILNGKINFIKNKMMLSDFITFM